MFDFSAQDIAMFSFLAQPGEIVVDGGPNIELENGVIFDSPHQIITPGGELVDSRQYQATVITDDLTAATIINMETEILIAATTYTIKDQRPDGAGFTLLDLVEG